MEKPDLFHADVSGGRIQVNSREEETALGRKNRPETSYDRACEEGETPQTGRPTPRGQRKPKGPPPPKNQGRRNIKTG